MVELIDVVTKIDEYKKSIDHLQNTLKSYEENKSEYNKQIDSLKKDNENLQKKFSVPTAMTVRCSQRMHTGE